MKTSLHSQASCTSRPCTLGYTAVQDVAPLSEMEAVDSATMEVLEDEADLCEGLD